MKKTILKSLSKLTHQRSRGQIFVLFALMIVVIVSFAAMGIDFGLMYLKKAKLSRSVDSLGLRLAGNISTNNASNARVALETLKANYAGFLSNVVWDETNNTVSPASAMTITAVSTGTTNITITNDSDKLILTNSSTFFNDIYGNNLSKIVTVSARATTKHYPLFLPISGIKEIDLGEVATARRVPTVICLILDTSGSMTGNNGYQYLPKAVTNFVANFKNTQDQDFMAVVTFSSCATLRWPTTYRDTTNASNYPANMLPSTNFVDPINAFMTNTPANGGISFANSTCGQEGIRLGYRVVNNFLHLVPEDQRKNLRVFYIIFTDGDFNTVRGYFTGKGYSTNHDTNTAPWFHRVLPVNCESNIFTNFTSVKVYTSATASTTYNLNDPSRFGNYDASNNNISWTLRPGISGTIYNPANSKGSGTMSVTSTVNGDANWRKTNGTTTHRLWTNYFLYRDNKNLLRVWDPNGTNTDQLTSNNYTYTVTNTAAYTNVYQWTWWVSYFNLCQQNNIAPTLWMPDMPVYDTNGNVAAAAYNPVYTNVYTNNTNTNTAYAYSTNYPANSAFSTNTGLTSRLIACLPGGSYYANNYRTYIQNSGTGNRGPNNALDGQVGYACSTVRLNDFYPGFFIGDYNSPMSILTHTNDNAFTNGGTTISTAINSYASTNGKATNFYAYSSGTAQSISSGANSIIGTEGYWLSMMQAWIMRTEQNAKIYFVGFTDSAASSELEKRQIANDKAGVNGVGITPFFSEQQVGAYYQTTDQTTLSDAFKDIAQKIGTQLTR